MENKDIMLFKAMNIIANTVDKDRDRTDDAIGDPYDIQYYKDFMIYNGKKIPYPKGYEYNDDETGFTVDGTPNSLICFSTLEYIFISDGKEFTFYSEMSKDTYGTVISDVKRCVNEIVRSLLDNKLPKVICNKGRLFVDFLNAEQDGQNQIDRSIQILIQIYSATYAMRVVNEIVDSAMDTNFEDSLTHYNTVIDDLTKPETVVLSCLVGKDVPSLIFSIISNALSVLISKLL